VRMVELLLERSADGPLLVLLGVRPDAIPAWLDRAGPRRLELDGLAEPETQRLATLVARASVDAADARRIHRRTAGNPLFVGETVRAYLEDGTLERRGGRAALSGAGRPRLPVTMRAVIGARIDALDPEAREVLDVAAVVGVVFHEATVVEVLDGAPVRAALDRIGATALVVHERRGRWRFAHGLIHEAAYAGLLARRRRAIHARLADLLEARSDAAGPGLVAAHRVAAGQAALAVPLLRHAASAALAVGAVAEATGWWRQAAELAGEPAPTDEAGPGPTGVGPGRGSGGRPRRARGPATAPARSPDPPPAGP
jgi:predicted ATPase